MIDGSSNTTERISNQLVNGEISLADWQFGMAKNLKLQHIGAALAAGGPEPTQADYGLMGAKIKEQYKYLNNFAKDIASGEQLLNGSLLSRANLYDQAARGTYHDFETLAMEEIGNTQARRVLGISDHCGGCQEEAIRGWVPITQVAPIGSKECRSRCHCSIIYR